MSSTTVENLCPLTKDIDVTAEASIVWVKGGLNEYPYLRESYLTTSSRSRPLKKCRQDSSRLRYFETRCNPRPQGRIPPADLDIPIRPGPLSVREGFLWVRDCVPNARRKASLDHRRPSIRTRT